MLLSGCCQKVEIVEIVEIIIFVREWGPTDIKVG
jgi:hypothetical protein